MLQPDISRQNNQLFNTISSNLGSGYVQDYGHAPKSGYAEGGAGGYGGGGNPLAGSMDRIMANTEGRAKALDKDPRMNQAMDFFSKVMAGGNNPYTDESKRAMLGKQANATAGAQAAQMQALREQAAAAGGSIYDPSFQAKSQEIDSNRQGMNLDAMGDIESRASEANFAAQMGGAQGLTAARSGQNAQINQMSGLAAEHLGRQTAAVPSGSSVGAMPLQTKPKTPGFR